MNFFKRFSSFAFNSWKDSTDFYDQNCVDSEKPIIDSVHVEQCDQEECLADDFAVRRKPLQGFFKKRFSKKKLVTLDDPRSPTIQFERTPIQQCKEFSDILSPFNVTDMLETVQSAIDKTPTRASVEEVIRADEEPIQTVEEQIQYEKEEESELEDNLKVDDICKWNQFKYNEKILTESLIVEVSSLEIKNDFIDSFSYSSEFKENIKPENETTKENSEITEGNCKIIGFTSKNEKEEKIVNEDNIEQFSTSTPKKQSKLNDCVGNKRTPLASIKNSPFAAKSIKNNNNNVDKKKKISNFGRQLPKAPSTPMTPLFRSTNRVVNHFDKENF